MNDFIKRLRLERALRMLANDPRQNLTRVALSCGFSSSSDFSRSFKRRYGVPPSAFDVDTYRAKHRDDLDASARDTWAGCRLERLSPGRNPDGFTARVRELPERTVAYPRVLDSYRPDAVVEATNRLMDWARQHGWIDRQWLGYMWDDPTVTDLKQCRYDVAVEVDEVRPNGEIGRFDFPKMSVAEVEIRGSIDLVMRALDWLFRTWLPTSGYVPANQPCFEAWIGPPFAHGDEHFEVVSQLPVERI